MRCSHESLSGNTANCSFIPDVYIQQSPYIFNLSLAENIAIEKNIKQEDIKKIRKIISLVGLENFVENLENGLDTMLLDKGINISGGQKQKISIARALYKDKEIIILDEVFSNLDKDSKSEIRLSTILLDS